MATMDNYWYSPVGKDALTQNSNHKRVSHAFFKPHNRLLGVNTSQVIYHKNVLRLYQVFDPWDKGYIDTQEVIDRFMVLGRRPRFCDFLHRLISILEDLKPFVSNDGTIKKKTALEYLHHCIFEAGLSCPIYSPFRCSNRTTENFFKMIHEMRDKLQPFYSPPCHDKTVSPHSFCEISQRHDLEHHHPITPCQYPQLDSFPDAFTKNHDPSLLESRKALAFDTNQNRSFYAKHSSATNHVNVQDTTAKQCASLPSTKEITQLKFLSPFVLSTSTDPSIQPPSSHKNRYHSTHVPIHKPLTFNILNNCPEESYLSNGSFTSTLHKNHLSGENHMTKSCPLTSYFVLHDGESSVRSYPRWEDTLRN